MLIRNQQIALGVILLITSVQHYSTGLPYFSVLSAQSSLCLTGVSGDSDVTFMECANNDVLLNKQVIYLTFNLWPLHNIVSPNRPHCMCILLSYHIWKFTNPFYVYLCIVLVLVGWPYGNPDKGSWTVFYTLSVSTNPFSWTSCTN